MINNLKEHLSKEYIQLSNNLIKGYLVAISKGKCDGEMPLHTY